ncbi:MAG: hypothetical protein VB036_12780 [Propionicimonas sp.]|nr:hypothetical protein [Propionicimonas sp.]
MSRKARVTPVVVESPDLAGRIAWSYLAAVLGVVAGGLAALIAYQVVRPLACSVPVGGSDELADLAVDCALLWAAILTMLGFAAAYAGALVLLKVETWWGVWLGVGTGLLALLLGLQHALDWWWWVVLLVLPAAAVLASTGWSGRTVLRRVQLATLGLAFVILGILVIVRLAQG